MMVDPRQGKQVSWPSDPKEAQGIQGATETTNTGEEDEEPEEDTLEARFQVLALVGDS